MANITFEILLQSIWKAANIKNKIRYLKSEKAWIKVNPHLNANLNQLKSKISFQYGLLDQCKKVVATNKKIYKRAYFIESMLSFILLVPVLTTIHI